MLKTCFECLTGTSSRVEHDTYETRLNGHTQTTMWLTLENEEVFRLPKCLKNDDIISIRGIMAEHKEKIIFSLKSDVITQNNQDFVLQMILDFSMNTITLITNKHEQINVESPRPSQILNTTELELIIQVRNYEDSIKLVDVVIGGYPLDPLELDRNTLESISYFTLNKDVMEVKELTFKF